MGTRNENSLNKEKKGKWLKAILFIACNIVLIWVIFKIDSAKNTEQATLKDLFRGNTVNFYYVFAAVGMFFVALFADGMCFFHLIRKMTGKNRLDIAFKTGLYGRYFDNVTPFSVGGQPFQIYYLNKYGFKGSDALSIPFIRFLIKFFASNAAIILIFVFTQTETALGIRIAGYVGVFLNLLTPTLLMLCAFNARIKNGLLRLSSKVIRKLKVFKKPEETIEKLVTQINSFAESSKYLAKNMPLLLRLTFYTLLEFAAVYSAPFFICMAFAGTSDYWLLFVSALYCQTAASFIPTPGTAGASELTFYTVFAQFIAGKYLFFAVILWRLITFYFYLAGGVVLHIVDALRKQKKPIYPPSPFTKTATAQEECTPLENASAAQNIESTDE